MKKIALIILLIILLVSCGKKTPETFERRNAYIKDIEAWAVADENEIGKKISDIDNKQNLSFGERLTIIGEKRFDQTDYYKILLKNKKEFWVKKDNVAEKFIVVNKKDTIVYGYPEDNFMDSAIMQLGDFGIITEEKGDWLNVDFMAYRPKNSEDRLRFIGPMWIKKNSGYSENIDEIKEAFYLYYAYYFYYIEKDVSMINYFIKKALEISKVKKRKSKITPVILEFQKKITSQL